MFVAHLCMNAYGQRQAEDGQFEKRQQTLHNIFNSPSEFFIAQIARLRKSVAGML
jgi:hypothetical protein